MSEKKEANRRYLGKIRNMSGSNGPYQKIYMDNVSNVNKDGTANTNYKGALVWADAETGKNYHVKQMSFWIPKEGMHPKAVEKGYSCFITINLNDEYEVTVLG
jgi:hypothetical protein